MLLLEKSRFTKKRKEKMRQVKFMLTVFFDITGIVHKQIVSKGNTYLIQ